MSGKLGGNNSPEVTEDDVSRIRSESLDMQDQWVGAELRQKFADSFGQ